MKDKEKELNLETNSNKSELKLEKSFMTKNTMELSLTKTEKILKTELKKFYNG